MFRNMLVPVDGGPFSERALPYAEKMARDAGARLVLVLATRPLHGEAAAAARERLAALVARARDAGVEAEAAVYDEEPAAAILKGGRERASDLVIIASHARGEVGRWFHGSVADTVIREGEVPVLVIPPGCEAAPPAAGMKIAVPLDGSAYSNQAIPPAEELAGFYQGTIVLLYVVEPIAAAMAPGASLTELDPGVRSLAAKELLEQIAFGLRARAIGVSTYVTVGAVADSLARISPELKATLIVMATRGLGGLVRTVLGSTATALLQQSTLPVLLVRPRPEAATAI